MKSYFGVHWGSYEIFSDPDLRNLILTMSPLYDLDYFEIENGHHQLVLTHTNDEWNIVNLKKDELPLLIGIDPNLNRRIEEAFT